MTYEIRNDASGAPDDMVFDKPDFVHIERMDENLWWAAVYFGKRRIVIWLRSAPHAGISAKVDEEEM